MVPPAPGYGSLPLCISTKVMFVFGIPDLWALSRLNSLAMTLDISSLVSTLACLISFASLLLQSLQQRPTTHRKTTTKSMEKIAPNTIPTIADASRLCVAIASSSLRHSCSRLGAWRNFLPGAAASVVHSVVEVGTGIAEDDWTRQQIRSANTMKVVNRQGRRVEAALWHRHVMVAVKAPAFLAARAASAA